MKSTEERKTSVRDTLVERYGEDYWRRIGKKGGQVCCEKGFALNHELAVRAGRIGGRMSSRSGVKNGEGKEHIVRDIVEK